MKVKHYNEMMAYLTRPGFNGGGSVSNKNVLPKRKPPEEVKKRKKINYEKIKQYLGEESRELIERELGFKKGGDVEKRRADLGKIRPQNQEKLDNLKKLILKYNNDPKALYDTTGKMKASKVVTKNSILIEAGFEKGMLSMDVRTGLGKAANEEFKKLLKPAQKFENYMNNVMLAEDALAKDFINPRAHMAKKFGISYDSEQIKNFFRDNRTVKENSKLFKTVLSQKLARDLYLFDPDGTPRTMAEVSERVANKLPSKFGIIVEDSPHKFILQSASRNFLRSQKLGLEPKVTFLTNPETTAPKDLVFIDNETGKLYSSNLQEDFFEFRGQKYKNNYLLKDNARQIYPEFESIYKMFEEDIPEYKKATITINGKEKNLDQYYRDKYAKESGRDSYYKRRSAEVDHGNLLNDPFGRKKYGFNQGGIRLIGARENRQAGMLILNQSPNLQDSLEKIGFINNDQSTTDFVNRMRNNATKKGMVFRGGEGVVLGMNRFNPELLDFRKLPDDVKNVSDVIGNLIKTPTGKRLARQIVRGGKFTGIGVAGELAFAAPFAADDYASGLSKDRIIGNAFFADLTGIGQSEQEEIRKAVGERGYATQTISELGERLPVLQQQYEALNDQNDPGGLNRDKLAKIYNKVSTEYNNAYDLFVTDEGDFDKGLYNQDVTNYAAGLGQIEKFRAAKEKERGVKEASKNVTGFELDLGFAGGGIAKQAGDESGKPPESGTTPDGPSKGLEYLFKNGMKEEE